LATRPLIQSVSSPVNGLWIADERSAGQRVCRSAVTATYEELLLGVVELLEAGRRQAARAVHLVLTSTYWLVGKRLVEHEQKGHSRAPYGAELLKRLSKDFAGTAWPWVLGAESRTNAVILSAVAEIAISHTSSFHLSWSHYVRLLSVPDSEARQYYEMEALRSIGSVRHQ
jgi:hypothetical protein